MDLRQWINHNGIYIILFLIISIGIFSIGLFTINSIQGDLQKQHVTTIEDVVMDKHIIINDAGHNEYHIKLLDGEWYSIRGANFNQTEAMYNDIDLHHKYDFVVKENPNNNDTILKIKEL